MVTAEHPTIPMEPVTPPHSREVPLDPDNPNIFDQLEFDAHAHHNPEMIGVGWTEQDGLRHTIVHHDVVVRTREEVHRKFLPRLHLMRGHIRGGPAFVPRTKTEQVADPTDYWRVEVTDPEGHVVDTKTFMGRDAFQEYFYVNEQRNRAAPERIVPRPISDVSWANRPPRPPAAHDTIAVRTPAPEATLAAVAHYQLAASAENWEGLTWTDADGNQKQITAETAVARKTGFGPDTVYPDRVFEVRTRNPRTGQVTLYHTYSIDTLQAHFNERRPAGAPPLNLQLRVPRNRPPIPDEGSPMTPTPEAQAWRRRANHRAGRRSRISMERAGKVSDALNTRFLHYAEELHRYGLIAGLPGPEESGHMILETLLQMRYYQRHPSEAAEAGFDLVTGNPFEHSPEGRRLRCQAMDLLLGKLMYGTAVSGHRTRTVDMEGDEPVERVTEVYEDDFVFKEKLQAMIYKDKIEALIKKRKAVTEPELTPAELGRIGAYTRLSLGYR